MLLNFCAFVPVFVAALSVFFLDQLRDSNMCNGREEVLRFNINNFLQPVSYNEFVVQLPLYHPYSVLLLVIGKLGFKYSKPPKKLVD